MPQVKNRLASYKDGRVVVQPDNPDYPWNARCLENRTLKVLKVGLQSVVGQILGSPPLPLLTFPPLHPLLPPRYPRLVLCLPTLCTYCVS